MDHYCVVLCGLQGTVPDNSSTWQPVAQAMKLEQAEFEQRIVAALPRIVRRKLDRASAERIAQLLQAMDVQARVVADDDQLAYIQGEGTTCGPLPLSALADFIAPDQPYRLHGSTTWMAWPPAPEWEPATMEAEMPPLSTLDNEVEAFGDEWVSPTTLPDGHEDEAPTLTAMEAAEETTTPLSDESAELPAPDSTEPAYRAGPPPLPSAAMASPATATDPTEDAPEADMPASDPTELAADDELINPADEAPTADDLELVALDEIEAVDVMPPRRSKLGRWIILLVLAGVAYWAYSHWIADTQPDFSGPAMAPPKAVAPQPAATPVPATSTNDALPVPAASVAAASSAPAPASTAAVPAGASSARAPASSAPAPATSTATPATATSSGPAAAVSVESSVPAPAASVTLTPASNSSAPAPVKPLGLP